MTRAYKILLPGFLLLLVSLPAVPLVSDPSAMAAEPGTRTAWPRSAEVRRRLALHQEEVLTLRCPKAGAACELRWSSGKKAPVKRKVAADEGARLIERFAGAMDDGSGSPGSQENHRTGRDSPLRWALQLGKDRKEGGTPSHDSEPARWAGVLALESELKARLRQ